MGVSLSEVVGAIVVPGPALLTVQLISDGLGARSLAVRGGGSLAFCACADGHCGRDLAVQGAAGVVRLDGRYASIDNRSAEARIRLWNLERPEEFLNVLPRQARQPVPFELSAVSGTAGHIMTIYGSEQSPLGDGLGCWWEAEREEQWLPADGTLGREVLRELCAPALSGRSGEQLPSAQEIARVVGTSVRAVHAHVDYLVKRLAIDPPSGTRAAGWKRRALVDSVLKRGILRSE